MSYALSLGFGATFGALCATLCASFFVLHAFQRARRFVLLAPAWAEQLAGNPRRSRARTRLLARDCPRSVRAALSLCEANALLWEGKFARAILAIDSRVAPANDRILGIVPTIVKLEALLFDGRIDDARALFDERAATLRASREGRADVLAIEAMLALHRGDLEIAEERSVEALTRAPPRDPIVSGLLYVLAAIAHRRGNDVEARRLLARTIREGGARFTTRWAEEELRDRFPGMPVPARATMGPRASRERPLRELLRDLTIGVEALVFRTARFRARSFTRSRVARLVLFDAAVAVAVHAVELQRGARVFGIGLLGTVAPVVLLHPWAELALRRVVDRDRATKVLGGLYAALPLLLVACFAVARLSRERGDAQPRPLEALVGAWALAVLCILVRAVVPKIHPLRNVGWSLVVVVGLLVPVHLAAQQRVFYAPIEGAWMSDEREELEGNEEQNELAFMHAAKLAAAEEALLPGRPGFTDMYFVGGAGWASQGVFLREARFARALFDEHFETKGRSLLLANDPSARELPAVANVTLRHALKAVGERMNREEDVLFLFVTSHGSSRGIALDFGDRGGFQSEVLKPAALRAMLDEAGILWRVLAISGCESGVFIEPLRDEQTLVTTASSADRPSYGCGDANDFTDFGRALFAEELPRNRSFVTAFANVIETIGARESDGGVRASLPQVAEGARIAEKLRELQKSATPGPATSSAAGR